MAKSKKSKKSSSTSDNFLLLHGEKFVFALVFLLAIWLISRGSGLEKFTMTPEEIKESAAKAEDRIQKNNVPLADVDETLVVYNYSEYSRRVRDSLKAGPYQTLVRWDQSFFPDKIKRPNLTPLPVENLRATACVGAIRYQREGYVQGGSGGGQGMSGPSGGQGTGATIDEGKHWVTVTGLIPIGKEFKEYGKKFGNAQYTDDIRDTPIYVFYEIERGVKGEDGEIDWTPINLSKVYEDQVDRWSGIGIDPVDPIHAVPVMWANSPRLTMPCPPMVNKPFGVEVTNSPKIPLLSEEQMQSGTDLLKMQKIQEEEFKKLNKRDFDAVRTQSVFDSAAGMQFGGGSGPGGSGPGGFSGPGGSGRYGAGGSGPGGMGMTEGFGGGAYGASGPGGMRPNQFTSMTSPLGGSGLSKNVEDDFYLFRHFDFDVEEGVTYYYRVKLFLANPNFGLDINLVEDPNTVGQAEIASDFSAPSNPVSRGNESRILVESIEPPTRAGQEPKITLASIYFNTEDARESIVWGKKMVRGQVANYPREAYKPIALSGIGVTQGMEMQPMGKKNKNAKSEPVDYISDVCVLDTVGGEKINGSDLRSPVTLLVLDPNGLIELRKLDEDTQELSLYQGFSQGRQ